MPPEDNVTRDAILDGPYLYTERPKPMPGDLRISWGIAMLLLALRSSRGQKASFNKLQFLAHAVRSPEGRDDVRSLMRRELHSSEVSVRVEPWLNRAVAFAHAQKLVEVSRGKSVALTDSGKKAAASIAASDALFKAEKSFLTDVGPKLTDEIVTKIWRMEDL